MAEKPKKQLILEAAFEVFSSKGFHGAKVDEIAEKAGIGKGTIYEYFKSKADVFKEMHKWYTERYFSGLEKGLREEAPATEKLYIIIKNHIIFLNTVKILAGKLLSESSSHVDLGVEFKEIMKTTYKEKINKVKGILEEGIEQGLFRPLDTSLLSTSFFGCLGGISHSMFLLDMDLNPDEIAEKFVNLLLNGIKK